MDIILRLKKVRRFMRSALLPVLWFFAAEIGAQAQTQDYSMSVGDDFGAVVDANGNLFVWGAIATEVAAGEIQQILPPEQWREVSVSRTPAASAHVLAIRTDGTLWAWGSNTRGQLGDGTTTNRVDPVQISAGTDWVEIAAGEFHSMARKSNGRVYLWGGNSYGQLGFGPIFNDPDLDIQPSVGGSLNGSGYIAISAGKLHSHAVRADGTLWTWGKAGNTAQNSSGPELGILVSGSYPLGPVAPTQVGTADGWTDLFSGYDATYALRDTPTQTGQLWVWGFRGDLGNGSSLSQTPSRVGDDTEWASISSTKSIAAPHTIGLKSDGTLYGWGVNWDDGQLGLPLADGAGSIIPANFRKTTPFPLETVDTFLVVGAGNGFTAVVRADGFLLTAGINDVGQLANGQTDDSPPGQDFFANSNLGVADLEATSLTISTLTPAPGDTVNASFSLQNSGTGEISTPFELSAVLSPTTSFNSADAIPLDFGGGGGTELLFSDTISAGESLTIPFTLDLPASIAQGNYYIVVRADSGDVIEETNETNNDAGTTSSFEFFPDLIFTDPDGLDVDPLQADYDPGDLIEIDIALENTGDGSIASGTQFDVRLFLSPTQTTDDSGSIELDSEFTVTLAADLDSGGLLAIAFSVNLPAGLATGNYYLGGIVDVNNSITEQTELLSEINVVIRGDGEANNVFFTPTAEVVVLGIPIPEAIDQLGLIFTTSGDATWFGQENVFTNGGDAVQSPSITAGESAAFSTVFADPVLITFDWRAETSSAENKLVYRVIGGVTGGGVNEIFGDTNGWLSVQRVVPAGAEVEWEYVEGVDAAGDVVYVDNLEVFTIDKPELVIDGVNLTESGLIVNSGTYVLKRDQLNINVNSRNQGTSTTALSKYAISVYLSKDRTLNRPDGVLGTPDDILVRQDIVEEQFFAGSPAVNGFSINLPENLDPGSYYVIAYIDDFSDADGVLLPGATDPTGQIDEYTAGGFPGETNNQFITADPVVEIVALPDLVVTEVNPEPDYYFIRDADGNPNKLDFDFTIANEGLAAVNETIRVRVLLSRDVDLDPATDYVVLDYEYTGGLAADGTPASEVLVNPDAVDIRADLVSLGYIGERLFFGVYIDALEAVEELDETNNGTIFADKDFIFSEVSVAEAFEFIPEDGGAGNSVIQDTTPSFDGELPWVGQTTTTIDGVDAAMSLDIGNLEVSAFETSILATTDTFVTFRWKVSSQNDEFGRDELNFYIDDLINPVASIAGEEDGWIRVSRLVAAGNHTFRWEYIKDELDSAGEDRGWVDDFSFQVPNLVVEDVEIDDSIGYIAGDTIDTWSVTIRNIGLADVPPTPSFDVQIRVSGDNLWGNDGDFVLFTLSDNDGLTVGESRTYSQATNGPLTIPAEISLEASYYVGAYVDWDDEESATGSIPESNETDNDRFTGAASLDIAPSVLLNVAIDDEPATLTLEVGGPGGWFGVDDSQIIGGASDGEDAAKSGPTGSGETSYFQTVVEGPSILDFDWKVSATNGSNFLEFSINGVVQDRITGEVDWESKQFFIPAGTQELRWAYRKTGEAGEFEDAGWVDLVAFTSFSDAELVLTTLNYTAGEYVLDVAGIAGEPDQLLGTEYLDITVEAENQGEDVTAVNFTSADLEVRLSLDRTWGNGDDLVLGTVSQVEGDLTSGNLIRFLGPIQLGDSIPENSYYLMAKVDSNDLVTEYDEDNNIVISENRDIQVTRLPALRIVNPDPVPITEAVDGINFYLDPRDGGSPFAAVDVEEEMFHYTESPIRLRFSVQNVGLDRVEGSEIWTTQISLRGAKRQELAAAAVPLPDPLPVDPDELAAAIAAAAAAAPNLIDTFNNVTIELGDFTVQELMEGRSDAKPDGDILDFDLDLALPSGARLNDIIDPDFSIVDYLWLIEIKLDSTDVVRESEIVREDPALVAPTELPWWIFNPFEANGSDFGTTNTDQNEGLFGISFQPSTVSEADWELLYGVTADASGAPADVANFLAYAFNRNPADGDTTGNRFPGTYGVTDFEGDEYLSIAFDIVTRADDLIYTVQADDNVGFTSPEPIVVIDGPYNTLTGATSLTGDGGLLLSEGNVTSVLDQGYSARVTVKDSQDVTVDPMRFIRVLVDSVPVNPVPDP